MFEKLSKIKQLTRIWNKIVNYSMNFHYSSKNYYFLDAVNSMKIVTKNICLILDRYVGYKNIGINFEFEDY